MLKYFKRQQSQRSVDNANESVASDEKRHSLLSTSSFCDEILADDDDKSLQSFGDANIDEEIFNYNSRLSMSIRNILRDAECITLFVQYLEGKNALPLIKFYLDVENFRIAALTQLEKQQLHLQQQMRQQSNAQMEVTKIETLNDQEKENDSSCSLYQETAAANKSAKIVPELKTLCDLSMHKPITDDEKSQIYAETSKHMTKNNFSTTKSRSLHSLTSQLSHDQIAQADISAASVSDAIAIYQKYLCPDALLFVKLPVNILSNISLLLCKRQDEEDCLKSEKDDCDALSISATCFDEAQNFVIDEMEKSYLNGFLQSPFYCKFCLELIKQADEKEHGEQQQQQQQPQLNVYDILYSEVTLFFFMEYLEQHNERECLDFWTAAINFRKSYKNAKLCGGADDQNDQSSWQQVQADAMIIYKKFFSLQSEERLWLSDKLRSRVESAICAADANEIATCFDLALIVTAKYLDRKYLGAFLKSELFQQYVNELEAKLKESAAAAAAGHAQTVEAETDDLDVIDAAQKTTPAALQQYKLSFKGKQSSLKRRQHRKTLSDCTGDVFKHISQQNTLLAMQDSKNCGNKQFKHLPNAAAGTSLSIDSRQLTNPNLLWHRRYSTSDNRNSNDAATDINSTSNRLKFGRVNSLGRYERDFETVESFNQQHFGGGGSDGKNHWASLGLSGIKIKNAMRKLVNLPEHKAQEEIAWQIAEMIVNDVTSVTLRNSPLNKNVSNEAEAGAVLNPTINVKTE